MAEDPTLVCLIDTYCAAWNEPDPAHREQILKGVWAEGATYTDPRGHATGVTELVALIGQIRFGRPGARVIRTSEVDSHHGLARFAWRVVQADGTALPEGIDIAEISDGGKLLRIVGFFGPLVPGAPGRAEAPDPADAPRSRS